MKKRLDFFWLGFLRKIEIRYRLINSFILVSLVPLVISGRTIWMIWSETVSVLAPVRGIVPGLFIAVSPPRARSVAQQADAPPRQVPTASAARTARRSGTMK